MKKILTLIMLALSVQVMAQTVITGINIVLPPYNDTNTANWDTGTSVFNISAQGHTTNGRVDAVIAESRILLIIKKGGSKICGAYTATSAPMANFNSPVKVWSGANAVSLLGQNCTLPPGDYELSVQFFSNGAGKVTPLSDEKIKPFTIKGNDQQAYQVPQGLMPANGISLKGLDIKNPITFRWTPVVPRPQGAVTYRLSIWQLMQGQSTAQAIKANQPIITKDVENLTQVVMSNIINGPCKPPYMCDYVWNVQALNSEGKAYGANNGISEAVNFKVLFENNISSANLAKPAVANSVQITPIISNQSPKEDLHKAGAAAAIAGGVPLNNGCPRKNVVWGYIAAELNKVSHCAVPVNTCISWSQNETTEYQNLMGFNQTQLITVAQQNTMVAQANQWALAHRPAGCNNSLKSIIKITYVTNVIVGSGDADNLVGFTVSYGCCAGTTNNQHQ